VGEIERLRAHCKEVELEASEMVDSVVDVWVDRLHAFEGRLRSEIKSRMQRMGNSSSVLLADVEVAIEVAKATVRVTRTGASPSQILARQWKSRAKKAEAEVEKLREERRAVLDCINLYGDEVLHKALDAIGFVPRAALTSEFIDGPMELP
jgi:hypothetical protein